MDNIAQHLELLKLLKGDDIEKESVPLSEETLEKILSKYEPDVARIYEAFMLDVKAVIEKHIVAAEEIDHQAELDIVKAKAAELNRHDLPSVPKSLVFATLTAPYLLARLEELSTDFVVERLQKLMDEELLKK